MNFLKHVGSILSRIFTNPATTAVVSLAEQIMPQPIAGIFEGVVGIVSAVEGVFLSFGQASGTGVQKAAAALPAVKQLILSSNFMTGKVVADQAAFDSACSGMIDNAVALLNSLKAAQSTTQTATAAAPAK